MPPGNNPVAVMKTNVNLGCVNPLAATAALGGLLSGLDIAIVTGAGPFVTAASRRPAPGAASPA